MSHAGYSYEGRHVMDDLLQLTVAYVGPGPTGPRGAPWPKRLPQKMAFVGSKRGQYVNINVDSYLIVYIYIYYIYIYTIKFTGIYIYHI